MTYNKVYLDSDVILDLIFERYPFVDYTKLLITKCLSKNIELNTSALVVANIHYLVSKKLGKQVTKSKIKDLMMYIKVLSFNSTAIDFGLNGSFTDFEDAIQHFIATENKCHVIITRNIKDYRYSTIPALTTEQFLRTIL